MPLSRRLQILLDHDRFERLERRSAGSGVSIGALVRRAIDETYPPGASDPGHAGAELLAADPMPVEDWAQMKREMLDGPGGEPDPAA